MISQYFDNEERKVTSQSTCVCAKLLQLCPTLCDPMDCSPPGSFVHGASPGKNIRVGCHFLLQGIFPTQELSTGLIIKLYKL